jgi:predicted DNA-binding transcriptional regulator AlpA
MALMELEAQILITPGDRYIDTAELRSMIPKNVSDMTLWRWQRDPRVNMPAPVKLGADGRNYWRLSVILTWLQQREERSAAQPRGRRPGFVKGNADVAA